MTPAVIRADGLGKRYRLYDTPHQRLRTLLGLSDKARSHWALRDVSFELFQGQCLGVVGDNGAGKSTLLKLLAATLQPSHGALQRVGRITAILELGAGFHPDFTGRENLLFGGTFIGFTQAEMLQLADGIIAFSELGEAIDRPVKTYSSGMLVRLAFALVTAVQPEVLIVDEALSVGDQHFQKKCAQRIQRFRKNGCTVLFCSHSLYHVRQLCDRVLWLHQGEVKGLGSTEEVLAQYEMHVRLQELASRQVSAALPTEQQPTNKSTAATPNTAKTSLYKAEVLGLPTQVDNGPLVQLTGPHLALRVHAIASGTEAPSFGIMLEQHLGVGITSLATHAENVQPVALQCVDGWTTWEVKLTFPDLPLHSGQYSLSFYLFDAQGIVVFDEWKDHIVFQWISPSLTPGLVRLPHRWS